MQSERLSVLINIAGSKLNKQVDASHPKREFMSPYQLEHTVGSEARHAKKKHTKKTTTSKQTAACQS